MKIKGVRGLENKGARGEFGFHVDAVPSAEGGVFVADCGNKKLC